MSDTTNIKRIRKVIFTFDNRDEFRYDVNQTIKIVDLKKILETGLQIPRFKLRLYHNNIEFTHLDDSKLEVLFPSLNEIIFKVSFYPLNYSANSEKEIAIKLRLGKFCILHENKYLCHFCFDCNQSFCSICHKNQLHADHETIEKYDYLQEVDFIIEKIFKKVSDDVYSLKFDNQEQVNNLEKRLKGNYFDLMRNLVTRIEERARDLLRVYTDVNINSLKEIEANLKIVKSSCIEALKNQKEELQMQNIIIDESIVISYYNTILQIYNQKKPIYNDIEKYIESLKSFNQINNFLDNCTKELNKVLENILNNNEEFINCEKEIKKNEIKRVDVEEVKTILYKDILNSTGKKPLSNKNYCNESVFNTEYKNGFSKFNNMEEGNNELEQIKKTYFKDNNLKNNLIHMKEISYETTLKNEVDRKRNMETEKKDLNVFNNQKTESFKDKEKIEYREDREKIVCNNISTSFSSSEVLSQLKSKEIKDFYANKNFKVTYSGKGYN